MLVLPPCCDDSPSICQSESAAACIPTRVKMLIGQLRRTWQRNAPRIVGILNPELKPTMYDVLLVE
ncbi:MAG: hypothetical protein EA377_08570 [Phycisphaerales bacterium]|nr:MAG: hypothetical protein EA377_08570 [Phycisphaerales bacterium]